MPTAFNVIHDLPPELWSTVTSFLPLQDVLSLISTCRTLYESKTTWVDILTFVCNEQGLYVPSFPLDDMSVDQLKRTAMGSTHRWPNLIKEFGYRYPHYSMTQSNEEEDDEKVDKVEISQAPRSLNPVSKTRIPNEVMKDVQRFLLIPGGRYLLVASPCFLRLVDLDSVRRPVGEGTGGVLPPCIVAQVDLGASDPLSRPNEFQSICDLTAVIMEDKETLRVGVASKLIVKVYDIALGRREVPASFEQLGVIRFDLDYPPRWEWSLSFLGERLFLRSSSRVLAWSFVTGRYVWGPGKDLHLSKSICTANTYIGFNDEAIFTWYISSWDANAQPVPSTPLPYTLDQTQPRIDRSPDWWISLDYDELQRDGEIRFVLPEGTSSHNTKLPILLDMFFVSGPFAIGYELPTIAYRYSLDVVVERDEAVQEVKFEQKAYWMFPSKAFEFFPRPFQGPLQHGYSSTTLVRNYLDRGTPRRTVDAIYSLVRIPPNPEDEDTADEGPPVGDGEVPDLETLRRRHRRRRRRQAQEQYPDLVLTRLHGDENVALQSISFCKSTCRSVYTVIEGGETRGYVADYLA